MTIAYKIARPDTAFSVGRPSTRKRPRDENGTHLKFIRGLPCAACGTRRNIEAAHIRMASMVHGKRETGKAEKPDDKFALPLCQMHHNEQHTVGEVLFWGTEKINPCDLALRLWGCTGDDETAEAILRNARAATIAERDGKNGETNG